MKSGIVVINWLITIRSTQLAPLAKKLVRSTCSKSSAGQVVRIRF